MKPIFTTPEVQTTKALKPISQIILNWLDSDLRNNKTTKFYQIFRDLVSSNLVIIKYITAVKSAVKKAILKPL